MRRAALPCPASLTPGRFGRFAAEAGRRLGPGVDLWLLEPRSRLLLTDWLGASFVDQLWNWSFADAVRGGRARLRLPGATLDERTDGLVGSVDFFGLNYYFRYLVRRPGARRWSS